MTPIRTWLISLLLPLTGLASAAEPPPVSAFFSNATFNGAMLSPNGRYLAAFTGGKDKRDGLAVVNLSDLSAVVVAQFTDLDISQAQWINNDRLLYSTADKHVGRRDAHYTPGLYAVDRDGKNFIQLAERRNVYRQAPASHSMLPWHTYMMEQPGAQNSDIVYVYNTKYGEHGAVIAENLLKLNTKSGGALNVAHPDISMSWLLDQDGLPRLMTSVDQNIQHIEYSDPVTRQWRTLFSSDAYTGKGNQFEPLAFGPDGSLYVSSYAGGNLRALYRYDLVNNKLSAQPIIKTDGFDFRGNLIVSNSRLLGVRVYADAAGTYWFDSGMKTAQETLDKLLPGTINLITPPTRPETPWVLVESYSDKQPHRYLIFNTETKRLSEVGRTAPAIKVAEMGSRELYYYKARDGLTIPAWLTLPPGAPQKNLPTVMLVHGGPWVRGGSWDWNPEAEFLASRGYAVIEPEFRGSAGYGIRHFQAGLKQWGLKMQDDIADGARWAISQGYTDPKRICIAGGSYGGYAALMGLVNDPDLYKCAIDWAGVTDINLMYDPGWLYSSDLTEGWKQYGMPELIGDPVKDAAQLQATSPLLQAARIKQPLLLAYGGADKRVPLNHGLKFRDAVEVNNHQVEWIEYAEEGHGWALPQNRIDFWTRVERFLDKNIGKH